jgi:DNA-binding NarL/FixJ family response regulator
MDGGSGTAGDRVLIVDDHPDTLALLHDALDEAGYTVLVATDGRSAVQRAQRALPAIVLLDAVMPGFSGIDTARALKADPVTAGIPIVFMTGLTDTEHVVAAFAAGGVDYVTKPIRPAEVLARIATHVRGAREQRQARQALDAFGHASFVMQDGRIVWQTPLARQWLAEAFADEAGALERLAPWVQAQALRTLPAPLLQARGGQRYTFTLHEPGGDGGWLVVLRRAADTPPEALLAQAFALTAREAQVLHWVTQGKTNRDIGDILGMSPRTVTKHLEHVFAKLGVETRTAAAKRVMESLAARPA